MPLPPTLVDLSAPAGVAGAVRRARLALGDFTGVVVSASNFTPLELVVEHVRLECGACGVAPPALLPAHTAAVFGVPAGAAGAAGAVDWCGIHPEEGEFHFEVSWDTRRAGAALAARHFHALPWPACGPVLDAGMAVPTAFLRVHAERRGDAGPHAAFALCLRAVTPSAHDEAAEGRLTRRALRRGGAP
jgi:hypothetical protein